MSKRICSIDDCEKIAVGRGWCPAHWYRWRMHGDPLGGGPGHIGKAIDWPDATRTCTQCGDRKPLSDFHKVKDATLGHRSNCKACRSTQMKLLYAKNPEEKREKQRTWRVENPEIARAHERARYLRPEYRELLSEINERRRTRIASGRVDVGVTRANLRQQYGDDCFYCGVLMTFVRSRQGDPRPLNLATLEHVVAISRGGTHTWDNVVLACWSCNCSKRHSSVDEWLIRKPRLVR